MTHESMFLLNSNNRIMFTGFSGYLCTFLS